jgi:putative hydrolase of the HAD superfamily
VSRNRGANPRPESPRLRAVFFDAGGTLIHPDPPVEEIYAREFSSTTAARFSSADLSRALTQTWSEVHAESRDDRYGGVRGEAEFWRAFLNRVRGLLDGGVVSPEIFARLAAHFRDPASWAVFEDVRGTLAALESRGMPMAVVSNWDSSLPALLEKLGLARYFRVVSVSAIEGTGKPSPEIFRRTCDRLEISAVEVLHVGDSLAEDYDGARAAGLEARLLDREGRHADFPGRIATLADLPGLLRGPGIAD